MNEFLEEVDWDALFELGHEEEFDAFLAGWQAALESIQHPVPFDPEEQAEFAEYVEQKFREYIA